MLTLRKAKTAMCKLDIYNERFRYLSCAFQISVVIVSDICRVRFRYLSCAFQISVVIVSDICRVRFRYLFFSYCSKQE